MPSGATFSSGPGGTSATVTIPIIGDVVNESDISREVYNAFALALGKVLTHTEFAKGMLRIIKRMGKEMESAMAKSAKVMGDTIAKAFAKIPGAASKASSSASSSMGHMIPHTLEAAITRLISQFNRLETAAKKAATPNIDMERILERLNRQATVATTEGARQQTAALNSALQNQAAATNAAAKRRVAIIQAMSQQIRALERGMAAAIKFSLDLAGKAVSALGAALRGIGHAAQAGARSSAAALRGIITAVQAVIRGVARLSSGLASGFARGFGAISRALSGALRRDEGALRSSLSRRERMVQSSASRQSSFLSKLITPQGLAAIGGGAGIGGLLTSGFQRFAEEERLQLTFQTLLQDGPKAAAVLENISDFARTTSFDFVEVAGSVAQFTAAFGDVDRAFELTRFLSDVVALTGGTTESLGRVRLAMTQIASAGRLDAANLKQITESLPGVPLAQILADRFFEGDLAAFAQARDAGELGAKITADAFFDAFVEGTQERFPEVEGFAQEAATTVGGLAANLKENFAIFGASLISVVEGPIKSFMGRTTELLNLVGGFVSGSMFEKTAEEVANPFADMAADAEVLIKDLPEEFQAALAEMGFEGPFVSAGDAAQWWEDNMAPPEAVEDTMTRLEELRTILGDFAKGAGGFLAAAGGAKLLFIALRFLISPLTIVTGLFGLLGAFWGRLMKSSPRLASAVKLTRQQFGNLFGTLKNTLKVVGGLISNAFFGDPKFFTNLGDRLVGVANKVGYLVGQLNEWLKWANDMIANGDIGLVIDSASQNIQGFVASLLGLTDAEQAAAQELEGNDFGNIFTAFLDKLENVPVLGPVVNFVRRIVDAISGALGGVGGFVGDIWDIIFGGDEKTTGESQLESISTSLFGTSAEQDSTGTKILDRLEDTFLGPVVRFFRGPFADGVESAIGGIVGFFTEGGFSTMLDNVQNFFAPALTTAGDVIQKVYDKIKDIAQPLIDKVTDIVDEFKSGDFSNLGGIVQGALAGAAAGFLLGGPLLAVVGLLAGAGFGAGLFGPFVESLNNAYDDLIKPALDTVWEKISGWFTDTFTVENMSKAAKKVLGLANEIGFWAGKIASDPRLVAAVLAMGIALLALLGSAILGVFQGIADNADEWGTILMAGIQAALDYVEEEGPTAVAATIGAIFTDPTVGAAVLAGGLLLGTSFGRKMIGGIGTFFKNRTQTGKLRAALRGAINDAGLGTTVSNAVGSQTVPQSGIGRFFNKIATGLGTAITTGATKLKNLGKSIGSGILGGLIAFEAGNLGGRSGSTGGLIMGLLTGAGIGFATAGLPGAIAGTVIAGIGAAIGASGEQAEQAAAEIEEYADAIRGLAGLELENAAVTKILENFRDTFSGEGGAATIQFLADAGFNARDFFAAVKDDMLSINGTMADFFTNLSEGTELLDPAKFGGVEQLEADLLGLGEAVREMGGIGSFDEMRIGLDALVESGKLAPGQLERMSAIIDELIAKGVDFDDIIDTLFDEQGELRSALDIEAGLAGLDEVQTGAEGAEVAIGSLDDAVALINEHLAAGDTAAEIQAILEAQGYDAATALDAVRLAAEGIDDGIAEAQAALNDFFTTDVAPPDITGLQNAFLTQVEGFVGQWEGITAETLFPEAERAGLGQDIGSALNDLINQGIDQGVITDPASLTTFIDGLRKQITEAPGISDGVEALMLAALDAYDPELTDIERIFDPLANATASSATLTALTSTLESSLGTAIDNAITGVSSSTRDVMGITVPGAAGPGSGLVTSMVDAVNAGAPELQGAVTDAMNTAGPAGFSAALGTGSSTYSTIVSLGGSLGTSLGTEVGTTAATAIASSLAGIGGGAGGTGAVGITPAPSDAGGVGSGLVDSVVAAIEAGAGAVQSAGQALGGAFARGLGGVRGAVSGAANSLKSAAISGLAGVGGTFASLGSNAGAAFARGIGRHAGAAAAAAAAIAHAAISAAQSALETGSPSKVFIGIGEDVGLGFMEGIEETEGDMASAISEALSKAIGDATDTAMAAAAEAGAAIFEAMFPSAFPGGPTTSSITSAMAAIRSQIGGQRMAFSEEAAGTIGTPLKAAVREALSAMQGVVLAFQSAQAELNEELADAKQHRKEIQQWDAAMKKLNAQLKSGAINQEKYNDKVKELGDRPEPLSFRERNILRSGVNTIDARTFAGQANQEMINEGLGNIQAWAQAALESGASAKAVAKEVDRYVAELKRQAVAAGLSASGFDTLARAMGLTVAQVNEWEAAIVSLNAATVAGQTNIQAINEQLEAIRQFGLEMLNAGFDVATVTAELTRLRNSLRSQLVQFGFTGTQIDVLIRAAGLAADQLAAFVAEMNAFAVAAANAAEAAAAATAAAELARQEAAAAAITPVGGPVVETLNVYLPYGDPEAAGLAAANAIAYNTLTSW